jgi:hypothetical protein
VFLTLIRIWVISGELELENVPLKKNIFRSWGLPVEVKAGVVGKIKIEFNIFKYFRNEPVLISIEDIYLVAGPLNLTEVCGCCGWDLRYNWVLKRVPSLLIDTVGPLGRRRTRS